ncbi:MAG: tetratricopeptide repeat protein [Candidatus Binatia bacterium]
MKWFIRGVTLGLVVAGCATLESGGEFASGRRALMAGDYPVALSYFEPIAKRDPNYVAPFSGIRESIWTYLGRAQYQTGKLAEAKASLERALAQIPGDTVAKLYLALTNLRLQLTEKAPPNPFNLQDVSFALREKIEPKRVAALVRERGVAFDLTSESESQLRKAGADEFLLDEIRKIRADASKRKKTSENQLGQGAKELATALTGIRDQLDYLSGTRSGIFWDPNKEIRSQIQTGLSLLSMPQPDWPKILSTGEWVGQRLEEEIDLVRRDETEELRRQERR